MLGCNVVDELHDENGLADSGTTEEANFAAFHIGGHQVDNFNACLKHFHLG